MTRLTWLSVLMVVVACGDSVQPASDGGAADAPVNGVDGMPGDARVPDATVVDASTPDAFSGEMGAVDVLFVIDNSGSMAEEQTALLNGFSSFANVLSSVVGGLPSLHIGIVSTDLGGGPFNISGCSGNGDNGTLQAVPRSAGCTAPTDAFIKDTVNPDGSRNTNYTGTLSNTFQCIAPLGINGCGFEQPLESMRRALNGSNPGNQGFLRADAALAVIFVTDEDDCSTENTDMFDTSQDSIDAPLGPLSSFRCFEFGVVCNPDTPRVPGPRTSCTSREDSPYMFAVAQYVSFLQALKADPNRVVVGAIMGTPTPVNVAINASSGNPQLQPSCTSTSGSAVPPIRLQTVVDGFAPNSSISSICDADYSTGLIAIATKIAAVLP